MDIILNISLLQVFESLLGEGNLVFSVRRVKEYSCLDGLAQLEIYMSTSIEVQERHPVAVQS